MVEDRQAWSIKDNKFTIIWEKPPLSNMQRCMCIGADFGHFPLLSNEKWVGKPNNGVQVHVVDCAGMSRSKVSFCSWYVDRQDNNSNQRERA